MIPWLGFTTVQTDLCCFSCSLLLSLLLVVVVVVGLLRCCFDLSVACVRQAYCSLLPATVIMSVGRKKTEDDDATEGNFGSSKVISKFKNLIGSVFTLFENLQSSWTPQFSLGPPLICQPS